MICDEFLRLVVMCASTPDKVELLQPPADAKPGDRVECEGYDCSSPDAQIKKELSDQILPAMSTNDKGEATFNGVLWKVSNGKGLIKSTSLTNVPIKWLHPCLLFFSFSLFIRWLLNLLFLIWQDNRKWNDIFLQERPLSKEVIMKISILQVCFSGNIHRRNEKTLVRMNRIDLLWKRR